MFGCEGLKLLYLTPSSKLIFCFTTWLKILWKHTLVMYILEGYNKHHFALNSQHLLSTPYISKTQILVFIFFTDLSSWEPIASTYLYSDEPSFQDFKPLPLSGNYLQFQLSLLHWMFPSFQYYKQWSLEEELQMSG